MPGVDNLKPSQIFYHLRNFIKLWVKLMAKTNLIQSSFIQYNLLLHELHAVVCWKPGNAFYARF